GRGFPLYIPGPQDLPLEYRRRGIAIGDVGRVTSEGYFDFFFNIYLPADDPINAQIPDDFVPLSPYEPVDVARHDRHPGDYVKSPSVTDINDGPSEVPGEEFAFDCVGPSGALLCLPHGARFENLENRKAMQDYAAKHAESWYKYANVKRGRGIENGELYLVTGSEKAQSWGIATFNDVPLQTEFQLFFRPTTDAGIGHKYRWHGRRCYRKCFDSPPVGTPLNQTTFIHAFAISVGKRIWDRLFGVGVCQLVDSSFLEKSGGSFVPYGSQGSSFLWSIFTGGTSGAYNGARQCTGPLPALGNGIVTDAFPTPKVRKTSLALPY
ncbi:hypothetical protein B0H12DRAFT_1019767, partial [Mycena haematopus]